MKKRRIKKMLSAITSVALMFSLMVIPSHAIVPGEDTYNGESTIYRYNMDTHTITPVDISSIDTTPGRSSYSALNEEAREKILHPYVNSEINLTTLTDGRVEVNPAYDPYSGVVLIVHLLDTDDNGIADDYRFGTDFMVSQSVMVTALHNLHYYIEDVDG